MKMEHTVQQKLSGKRDCKDGDMRKKFIRTLYRLVYMTELKGTEQIPPKGYTVRDKVNDPYIDTCITSPSV